MIKETINEETSRKYAQTKLEGEQGRIESAQDEKNDMVRGDPKVLDYLRSEASKINKSDAEATIQELISEQSGSFPKTKGFSKCVEGLMKNRLDHSRGSTPEFVEKAKTELRAAVTRQTQLESGAEKIQKIIDEPDGDTETRAAAIVA